MTQNQIAYWSLKETQRANREREAINRENLNVSIGQLNELVRSNKARESELYRSHRFQELQSQMESQRNYVLATQQFAETQRANKAREELQRISFLEQQRSNRENEAIRHAQNRVNELSARYAREEQVARMAIAQQQQAVNLLNARTAIRRQENEYQLGMQSNLEAQRTHRANEALTSMGQRFNYSVGMANVQLGEQRLLETQRSNRANEQLQAFKIAADVGTNLLRNTTDVVKNTKKKKVRLK